MEEMIIINGADVSKCDFIIKKYKRPKCAIYQNACGQCQCKDNSNCYYKQLQRALRENTNLKQNLDNYQNNPEMQKALTYYRTGEYDIQISILEKENKELKEQLKRNNDLVKIIKIDQNEVIELKKEIQKLKNRIIFEYHGIL